jgi:two-component system, NtrC family, response regulator PilR
MPDKKKILVVDKEPQVRELLQVYLARQGYDVKIAENAEEAQTRLAPGICDAVICGYNDAKGGPSPHTEILQTMQRKGSKAPVILLSSSGYTEEGIACAQQHGCALLSKVQPLDELNALLTKVLESGVTVPKVAHK